MLTQRNVGVFQLELEAKTKFKVTNFLQRHTISSQNNLIVQRKRLVLTKQRYGIQSRNKALDKNNGVALCGTFLQDQAFCTQVNSESIYTRKFAFYQAAKCLVQTLLVDHPTISLLNLKKFKNNVAFSVQTLPPIQTRTNLETLLIGFYAGNAGELFTDYPRVLVVDKKTELDAPCIPKLHAKVRSSKKQSLYQTKSFGTNCFKIDQFLYQSDAGLLERIKATFLVQFLIVNGSTYSSNVFNLQKNGIVGNLNRTEIKDKKVLSLFQSLEEQVKSVYIQRNVSNQYVKQSFTSSSKKQKFDTQFFKDEVIPKQDLSSEGRSTNLFLRKTDLFSQKNEVNSLCEDIVCKSLTLSIKPYGHWFRIYLPQIETHQRQPVSIDQFFTKRRELGSISYTKVHSLQTDLVTNLRDLVVPNTKSMSTVPCKNKVMRHRVKKTKVIPSVKFLGKQSFYQNKSFSNANKASLWYELGNAKTAVIKKNEVFVRTCACKHKEQVGLPSSDHVLTQRFAQMWPQELGYGTCHNLVLNTFSRAFQLISKNRELLDILADHLVRYEKIRIPEISRICSFYVYI